MNKSLPSEIITRRQQARGKERDVEVATIDRKAVLAMKPEQRSKWLTRVLQHAQEGRVTPLALFDILAHQKFVADLNDKMGRRMYKEVKAKLDLFSGKQQKHLATGCAFAKQFGQEEEKAAAPQAAAQDTATSTLEEMMARCRSFVREKQAERGERDLQQGLATTPHESDDVDERNVATSAPSAVSKIASQFVSEVKNSSDDQDDFRTKQVPSSKASRSRSTRRRKHQVEDGPGQDSEEKRGNRRKEKDKDRKKDKKGSKESTHGKQKEATDTKSRRRSISESSSRRKRRSRSRRRGERNRSPSS